MSEWPQQVREVGGWLRPNFTYPVPALDQDLIGSEKGVLYTCTKGVVFTDAVENSLKSKHEPLESLQ
jgi:hypothetical protein